MLGLTIHYDNAASLFWRTGLRITRLVAASVLAIGLAAFSFTSSFAAPYDAELKQLYELAKKEGAVVMYGDQSVEVIQKLGEAFKARFPGIDFDFFRGDSPQILQRFESETAAKRHSLDMLMSTERRLGGIHAKGWLAEYDAPVARIYSKELQPDHKFFYHYGITTGSFAYNTDLVKPSEVPKSWDDLLDPKWKGKIGMQDPKTGGGGAHSFVVRMHGLWGEEKWKKYMDAMGKQISKYGRYFQVREALASGEVAIQFVAYPDFTEPLKQKGAPVEWASTPDPMLFLGLSLGVSKFAPHPNAGRLLLNFLISEEAQKIIADAGKIPAFPGMRPGTYSRLNDANLVSWRIDMYKLHDKRWFDAQIRESFAVNR